MGERRDLQSHPRHLWPLLFHIEGRGQRDKMRHVRPQPFEDRFRAQGEHEGICLRRCRHLHPEGLLPVHSPIHAPVRPRRPIREVRGAEEEAQRRRAVRCRSQETAAEVSTDHRCRDIGDRRCDPRYNHNVRIPLPCGHPPRTGTGARGGCSGDDHRRDPSARQDRSGCHNSRQGRGFDRGPMALQRGIGSESDSGMPHARRLGSRPRDRLHHRRFRRRRPCAHPHWSGGDHPAR